jgi:ABC-type branched-subunit amino acid transport system substrate-binding protein
VLVFIKNRERISIDMARRFLPSCVFLGILTLIAAGCAPRQPTKEVPLSTRVPSIKSANVAALMRLGEDLFDQENFQEAAETYEHVLQNFPESPVRNEARYRLGLCYHQLNQPAKSVETLRPLVGVDLPAPRKVKILSLMAESFLNLEKPLDALRWYLAALQAADSENLETEIKERIRQVMSETLSEAELREVAFIYRDTYLEGYAKFLLAQRLFQAEKVDLSRELLSEVLRFYIHEDFYPEVETFLQELEEFVPDEYVLGCILPLSGPGASSFGQPSLNGITLAIHAFEPDYQRLNLRLIVKDSRSSPARAAEAVEELVRQEGVLAIVGPLFRATSETAAVKAEELRVPLITLTTKEDIALESDFVFRNGPSYSVQIRSLVTYAMDFLQLGRFAVFYPEDGYGKTLSNLFIHEVYRQGGDVVTLESYANSQMDFGHEIKRMVKIEDKKTTGREEQRHYDPIIAFDSIFIPDQADRVALIAPQLAYYDVYGVTLLGTNTWNNPALLEKAGKFVQDALVVDEFFSGSQSPVIADFVDHFSKTFTKEPTILAAQAFDAAAILVNLLEDHPILSREAMQKELTKIQDFSGVSSFNGFDSTGNAKKTPLLLTIQENRFRELSPDVLERLDLQ